MGLALSAKGNLPGKTGKPRKFTRWATDNSASCCLIKTADPEQHAVGVDKCVFCFTTPGKSLLFTGNFIVTNSAQQRLFFPACIMELLFTLVCLVVGWRQAAQ